MKTSIFAKFLLNASDPRLSVSTVTPIDID